MMLVLNYMTRYAFETWKTAINIPWWEKYYSQAVYFFGQFSTLKFLRFGIPSAHEACVRERAVVNPNFRSIESCCIRDNSGRTLNLMSQKSIYNHFYLRDQLMTGYQLQYNPLTKKLHLHSFIWFLKPKFSDILRRTYFACKNKIAAQMN